MSSQARTNTPKPDDDDTIKYHVTQTESNDLQGTKEARAATQGEHDLTIRQALKLYPKAIGFSLLFSTAVIMEGYDMHLLGALFGFTPFQVRYGTQINPKTGDPLISAAWQSGIKNGMNVSPKQMIY